MEKTEKLGLPPTGKLGVFRRWLGIYSKKEVVLKHVLSKKDPLS